MKRRSHRLRERSLRQSQHHTCIGERVIGEAREEAQSQVEREELETVTASHLGMEMTHLLVVSMKSCTPGLVESMLIFYYIIPLVLGASTILGASLILGASYHREAKTESEDPRVWTVSNGRIWMSPGTDPSAEHCSCSYFGGTFHFCDSGPRFHFPWLLTVHCGGG